MVAYSIWGYERHPMRMPIHRVLHSQIVTRDRKKCGLYIKVKMDHECENKWYLVREMGTWQGEVL